MSRPRSLAVRMMAGQIVVIAVGAITLAITAALIAPRLFTYHFEQTGEANSMVQYHAQEAFESSFALALAFGVVASVVGAGLLSWLLTKRISQPIAQLALAAEAVAEGNYEVVVPHDSFGRELAALSVAFDEMAEQLAQTDAARRQLLSDLAHELRTPLATLEAHIDGMEDGVVPSSADSYAVMRHQVARLRRLATDLKVLTAVEAHALELQIQELKTNAMVSAACGSAELRYEAKGVELRCLQPGSDVVVMADPDRLQQVLSNLLDTALRHTPAGGSVDVSCEHTAAEVTVSVSDTGDGITEDQLDAVFDRFHRADASRRNDGEGSGLGLTIARAIVIDHGGTLIAQSEGLGRGAVFRVTLPRAGAHE